MTQIEPEEQEDKPLDPAMESVRRKMIRLQIVSGSVMFISLMAVFGAVVYKAMGPSKAQTQAPVAAVNGAVPSDGPVSATASLPQGFVIENTSLAAGQLLFTGRLANGTRKAMVFDIATGRFVADVTIDVQ
jgi:hypothetical protein